MPEPATEPCRPRRSQQRAAQNIRDGGDPHASFTSSPCEDVRSPQNNRVANGDEATARHAHTRRRQSRRLPLARRPMVGGPPSHLAAAATVVHHRRRAARQARVPPRANTRHSISRSSSRRSEERSSWNFRTRCRSPPPRACSTTRRPRPPRGGAMPQAPRSGDRASGWHASRSSSPSRGCWAFAPAEHPCHERRWQPQRVQRRQQQQAGRLAVVHRERGQRGRLRGAAHEELLRRQRGARAQVGGRAEGAVVVVILVVILVRVVVPRQRRPRALEDRRVIRAVLGRGLRRRRLLHLLAARVRTLLPLGGGGRDGGRAAGGECAVQITLHRVQSGRRRQRGRRRAVPTDGVASLPAEPPNGVAAAADRLAAVPFGREDLGGAAAGAGAVAATGGTEAAGRQSWMLSAHFSQRSWSQSAHDHR